MPETRRVLLKQTQSPGDIATFTRPAYDLKRSHPDWEIGIESPCAAIFVHNPYTTELSENDPTVEVYEIRYDEINKSGWSGEHFSDAFRHDIEKKLNSDPVMVAKWGETVIPKTGILPEIFISDDEKGWYHQIHCTYFWDGQFWLLNAGRKWDNVLKQYHRWQAVVDILNDYWQGKVRIIQVGHRGVVGQPHYHPDLKGVFNLIGQTDLRQLIRLAYHSTGLLGPISLQFVLGAAFEKPTVVCAGGKEGTRWHIYNHVRWVTKVGCLPCAKSDGCWKGGKKGECTKLVKPADVDEEVPLCFEMTSPQELADRVIDYYEGGRLPVPVSAWYEDGKERFEEYYQLGEFPPEEAYTKKILPVYYPGEFCRKCGKAIIPFKTVPRGKCSGCGEKVSFE